MNTHEEEPIIEPIAMFCKRDIYYCDKRPKLSAVNTSAMLSILGELPTSIIQSIVKQINDSDNIHDSRCSITVTGIIVWQKTFFQVRSGKREFVTIVYEPALRMYICL